MESFERSFLYNPNTLLSFSLAVFSAPAVPKSSPDVHIAARGILLAGTKIPSIKLLSFEQDPL
jgi:hypothetical protein